MSDANVNSIGAFLQEWKNAFTKILGQMGGTNVAAEDLADAHAAAADPASTVQVNFAGGGALNGVLRLSCAKTIAVQFAQILMSEAVDPAMEFSATHSDGFMEFIRQIAGEVAVAWKKQKGLPVEINYQAEAPANFEVKQTAAISLHSDAWKDLALHMEFSPEFVAALSGDPSVDVKATAPAEAAVEVDDAESQSVPSNLALILDVQLEATIRFGEREMLLRDVFGLMPGAVVELDQLVNEPAELLVAGRLIAKGEVVVVDGNFGLRVSEVLSAAQRAAVLSL